MEYPKYPIFHVGSKASYEMANLLLEVDALIKDGTIPVGVLGISPNAAKMVSVFEKCFEQKIGEEVWITDAGLGLIDNKLR